MIEPYRIRTTIKPETIEDLGNGKYYYNYDIKSEKAVEDRDGEKVNVTMYNYIQIKLPAKPEYKTCVEAIIRVYLTQSQEFDLINSAQKDILSGIKSSEDITKYMEYLALLDEIKANIKKDFPD